MGIVRGCQEQVTDVKEKSLDYEISYEKEQNAC